MPEAGSKETNYGVAEIGYAGRWGMWQELGGDLGGGRRMDLHGTGVHLGRGHCSDGATKYDVEGCGQVGTGAKDDPEFLLRVPERRAGPLPK